MSDLVVEPRVATASDRNLAFLLLGGGFLGLIASFVLVVEKIALIVDPDYVPSCSLNPVLSCGSIMQAEQAEVLGFPNPLIGVAAFPILMATGAALLAGAGLARWYWWGLQVGATLGLLFVGWLIFQSLYRIGALCPYCMVVWALVIPIWWYVTRRNLAAGVCGERMAKSRPVRVLHDGHGLALTILFAAVIILIAERFWTYWATLL
ncbi:vitamin K epoxide reductase family protein [Nocardioides sp.]|uniref:vitamin K epoxide reductase family protein n=1 Tax=Nocardioides sp. TaxID=35761 RepID=UPI002734ECFF|nr:vitamin K epoxide reductase family protein [Nocardioides sp.]MDP3890116.1 vitamin K epoxide reductase family protein [Nocardioides sp.]